MVKRYDTMDGSDLMRVTGGDWVDYQDYAKLQTQIERFEIAEEYNSTMKERVEAERDKYRAMLEWIESEMKLHLGYDTPLHHLSCAVHIGDKSLLDGIQDYIPEGDKKL